MDFTFVSSPGIIPAVKLYSHRNIMPLLRVEHLALDPMRFFDGVESTDNLLSLHAAQTQTNLLVIGFIKF